MNCRFSVGQKYVKYESCAFLRWCVATLSRNVNTQNNTCWHYKTSHAICEGGNLQQQQVCTHSQGPHFVRIKYQLSCWSCPNSIIQGTKMKGNLLCLQQLQNKFCRETACTSKAEHHCVLIRIFGKVRSCLQAQDWHFQTVLWNELKYNFSGNTGSKFLAHALFVHDKAPGTVAMVREKDWRHALYKRIA